jgi:TnpA family transposase
VGYPSRSEADRLERWPARIELEDLRESFALGDSDRGLVFEQRGAENRLGLAVQLCALRFLGFVPEEITGIPEPALRFLCQQTQTEPHEVLPYGERDQTRSDHLALAREHLDFRPWDNEVAVAIRDWLAERAVEYERPSVLMSLLGEHLRAQRVVRPSVWVLARLIGGARDAAHATVLARLGEQLRPARCAELDRLLEVDLGRKVSEIVWLRTPIGRVGIKGALEQVAKYERLGELHAADVDLSSLPPSRRRQLAAQARRLDAQQLQRRDSGPGEGALRRHPILLVALAELHIDRGDELLDVFCRLLSGAQRRANTTVDRRRRSTARTRDELVELATTLSRIVLEENDAGRDPSARIEREIGLQRLRYAAGIAKTQLPPLEQEQRDVLHDSHSSLTRALSAILDTVPLRAHPADQPLLDALADVRGQRRNRFLPGVSVDMLPREYRAWVADEHGRVLRTRYELGLWCSIRDALRDGRLFRAASRKYLDPAGFLLPDREWARAREELAVTFNRPLDPAVRLAELEVEQTRLIEQVQHAVDAGGGVSLDDRGRLVSPQLRAEPDDPTVTELKAAVAAQIPEIELADLLIEVDQWTGFSDELRHAAGATPRAERLRERLYAAVVASGTLLGPAAMGRICDLSARQIAWAEEWYLDLENLASARQRITSYHHQLELTQHLGSGHFSSSDGHRVGQRGRPPTAAMLAREFGYQHGGLTVMSWTLDEYTTYGAKIVSVAEREATHTLDAIVHADAPDIREHTSDTHGYTDIVFAIFDLLGLRYLPRLRDLPDQRLYGVTTTNLRGATLSVSRRGSWVLRAGGGWVVVRGPWQPTEKLAPLLWA